MIRIAESERDIAETFDVMHQLRPSLVREEYVARIQALMRSDNYELVSLTHDGVLVAVAGYRVMDMLYCGRLLYVDDFVTDAAHRSSGHGASLLSWLKEKAKADDCRELQLISRVVREKAHRFYYREGLAITCFHFSMATDQH